jgi:REP element-mobilizing transposase RayT
MSTKRKIPHNNGVYFITFTCYKWFSLFEITKGYDIVYKWFDHLKSKGHYIVGYVIMPNHIHALIGFSNSKVSINTTIGNGKRFMAYEIIKRLTEQNENDLLEKLSSAVSKRDEKRGKLHEVFEESFDWKECLSDKFIDQKLDYMHDNPCKGVWNLAQSPVDYQHSSAKFYLTGEQGVYPVTHCGELKDIDLTRSTFTREQISAESPRRETPLRNEKWK